jgi:hypothetical protein
MYSGSNIFRLINDEERFSCLTTHNQFAALAHKLSSADLPAELAAIPYFGRVRKSPSCTSAEIEQWLLNAWNTEVVLTNNETIIKDTKEPFAIQWAFPQAYYSCFATILAKFIALGYTERSHTTVLKKYGTNTNDSKIPRSASFLSNGGMRNINYHNITKPRSVSQHQLDLTNPATVDNQICQFLKSTREIDLQDRAEKTKKEFKNKSGSPKKYLNATDWVKVSDGLGFTGLLDLLYRKRIKANYRDIDTFTSPHLDGLRLLRDLTTIVDRFNLINEAYIAKAIGKSDYQIIITKHHYAKPENRFNEFKLLL